jgi:hypothetical protein
MPDTDNGSNTWRARPSAGRRRAPPRPTAAPTPGPAAPPTAPAGGRAAALRRFYSCFTAQFYTPALRIPALRHVLPRRPPRLRDATALPYYASQSFDLIFTCVAPRPAAPPAAPAGRRARLFICACSILAFHLSPPSLRAASQAPSGGTSKRRPEGILHLCFAPDLHYTA